MATQCSVDVDIEAEAGVCDFEDKDDNTLREASVRAPSQELGTLAKSNSWSSRLKRWRFERGSGYEVDVRKLQDCPEGYPRLAAFLDSDDNFMIYRRFGYIQSRLLLDKQNELQNLEMDLEEMDKEDSKQRHDFLKTAEIDTEDPTERKKFMMALERKFNEYATLLASAKELTSTARPSAPAYRSFRNYFYSTRPLSQRDEPWIKWEEDLITLRQGREHAWLDDMIEHFIRMIHFRFIQDTFQTEETRRKSDQTDGCEVYYTRTRIERLVVVIITCTILTLFVAPIYILYQLMNAAERRSNTTAIAIGTLLVFTLAFCAVLLFFTRARRHEVLGAAAAYCAVLVVFLGNVQGMYPNQSGS